MSRPEDRFNQIAGHIADSVPVEPDVAGVFDDPEQRALAEALQELSEISETFQLVARKFPADALPHPAKWGELLIQEQIGTGSTAEVFRAYDPGLERDVALKLFRTDGNSEAALREGRLLATIRDDNVAIIYGADKRGGRAGLWMELFEGPTLRDYLRSRGVYPLDECIRVGLALCGALGAVHSRGLVHRDVKADNVFIRQEADGARYILGDFGVATSGNEPHAQMIGTPLYMAPEILVGGSVDARADFYSLGVLLYFLSTGSYPIEAATVGHLRDKQAATPGRSCMPEDNRVPGPLQPIIRAAMQKEPSRRFQSASQFAVALTDAGATSSRRVPWVIAAIVTGMLSVVLALDWMRDPPLPTMRVMVAPVANETGDRSFDSLHSLVSTQLSRTKSVHVVGVENALAAIARMGRSPGEELDLATVREIAFREQIPHLASLTLRRASGALHLTTQLDQLGGNRDTPTATRTEVFTARGDADVPRAVEDASDWLQQTISRARDDSLVRDRMIIETTTPSLEALDLYFRAERAMRARQMDDGILLLEDAIELDPDFSKAHMRLAYVLLNTAQGEKGFRHLQRGLSTLAGRRHTQREELYFNAMVAQEYGEVAEAADIYRRYQMLFPDDYYPFFGRAMMLRELGLAEPALAEFEHAKKVDESFYQTEYELARTNLIFNHPERIAPFARRLIELERPELGMFVEGASLIDLGELDDALRLFRAMRQSPRKEWQSRSFVLEASVHGARGDRLSAEDLLESGLRFDQRTHLPKRFAAEKRFHLAYLALRRGDRAAASRWTAMAIEDELGPRRARVAGTLFARAGALDEAQRVLDRLERRDVPLFWLTRHVVRGEMRLAEGALSEALGEFRAASVLEAPYAYRDYLARVLVGMGRLEEALEHYRRIYESPGVLWKEEAGRLMPPPGYWADAVEDYIEVARRVGASDEVAGARLRLVNSRRGASGVNRPSDVMAVEPTPGVKSR